MKHLVLFIMTLLFLPIDLSYAAPDQSSHSHCLDHLEANLDKCSTKVDGTKLTCLKLSHCNLNDADILELTHKIKQLRNKPFIIDLSFNHLSSDSIKPLKALYLSQLDLSHNHLTDDGILELAQNQTPEALILNHNSIGDQGIHALINANGIKYLDVAHNRLKNGEALKNNDYKSSFELSYLDLSNNHLKAKDMKYVPQLTSNKHECHLILKNNDIGDEGAEILVKQQHELITDEMTLDLSNNNIGDQGAKSLAKIKFWGGLDYKYLRLRLNNNHLTDEGVKNLLANDYIIEFGLANNAITDKSFLAISQTYHLAKLDISKNKISSQGVLEALNYLHTYQLFMNDIELDDHVIVVLAHSKGSYFHALSLRNTGIHDEAAYALAGVTWKYLDISHNHISKRALSVFKNKSGTVLTTGNQ